MFMNPIVFDIKNGGQTQSARDTTGTPNRLLSSRRISEHASGFDFYHAYLTEDQVRYSIQHCIEHHKMLKSLKPNKQTNEQNNKRSF